MTNCWPNKWWTFEGPKETESEGDSRDCVWEAVTPPTHAAGTMKAGSVCDALSQTTIIQPCNKLLIH
jgi:hypothetical protein